jgi:hypothetical protein
MTTRLQATGYSLKPTTMAWRSVQVVVLAALAATLAFAVGTLMSRPLDGSEGNFLFDASRIRRGLPLYVDPLVGAFDYGPVPSRFYVLYAPFWAALLSLAPGGWAPVLARSLSLALWLGLLGGLVVAARKELRAATGLGAAFVASLYPLALFAASGRPDAVASVLVGVALFRSVRRGRVGALEGALFALAPFFKPNFVAAGIGAMSADVFGRRARAWPGVAGASSCLAVCAAGLELLSGGAWVEHLVESTRMPLGTSLWLEQMASRAPFFALPLAVCFWSAIEAEARMAWAALAASTGWTVLSLAKVGSASNYWMEPCVAALVVLANVPVPPLPVRLRTGAACLAIAQTLWTGVAAVRSSLEAARGANEKAAALEASRGRCGAGPGDVVLADEAGLEQMLDGRVIAQPLIFTQMVARGRLPLSAWQREVERPEVRCLVMQSDWLERADGASDPDHDLFPASLRPALRAKLALVSHEGGLWVYGPKAR